MHKTGQSEGLLKTRLPLIGNVLKLLAKKVLIPSGLTVAASTTDAAIHKKMFGSGIITLIISNEKINDIMEIVKSFEESGLLIKSVSETIKNETQEQIGRFLGMLLRTLSAMLLGNLLTGKSTVRNSESTIKADKGIIREVQSS